MTLKLRLLLGAAAPFVFVLPAVAQTTISTATTTPVQTSTGGNVEVTTAGSVTVTAAPANTAPVTVNSNNNVTNAGTISTVNSNNTVGIRILPGFNSNLTNSGTISLIEDYTRTDTDSDEDLDGPLAQGTNRVGVLVEPGGTLTGNILHTGGSITIEGNDSYGVSIRSDMVGNYRQHGTGGVSLVGSNGVALDFRGNVTGNIEIGGSATSATGEGSVAVRVGGNVTGEFMIDGNVLSTGFTSTTLSNYEDPDDADDNDTGSDEPDERDADDLLVGGSAVEIRGDLSRGFLINGVAVGGADPTDDIKDVVQDFNENRTAGTVQTFGSAPAINIQSVDGGAGQDIVLSRVRETIRDTLDDDDDDNLEEIIGTFDYDYGFINRGGISASGLNMGFSATALKIAGSADGTHTTTVEGGIFNGGGISATSFEGNATGLQMGSGASSPLLLNTGSIAATAITETTHDAIAVAINAGASLPTVTNNGLMLAAVRGYDGDAIAFQDLSGTVTNFTNTSRLSAGFIDDDEEDDITSGAGRAIALDLSHSGSGVTLTQTDTVDNARIAGDVLFGVGNDQFNLLSGEMRGDIAFGAGSDTLNVNSAKLFGDTTFGGTAANVLLNGAEIEGNLALGNATGTLSFLNQTIYNGDITRTGAGAMSMIVNNSTMNNSADGTLALSSMTLANNAKVGFVIDNARIAGNIPIFNITGTADVAANTVFTPIFDQFRNQTFSLRVLNAGTLNLGAPVNSMLNANAPFIYNMTLTQPNPNAIDLNLSVKTAQQLGLNARQTGAYAAVLDLMQQDDEVGAAVTSIPGATEFLRGWSDLLPGSDAAVMRVLASNSTAAFGATAHRLDLITNKPDAPGGAWTEEFGVFHKSDPNGNSVGIEGGGFGVAAGIDVISDGNALIGAFAALESAELEEETRTGAPMNVSHKSFGAYGGWLNGNLAINGAASVGFVDFTSDRKVEIGSLSDRVKGEWSGQTYTAGARATYTMPLGWLDLKPFVAADYIGFQQDGYTETAATDDGLALIVGDSDASLATASYGLSLVGDFGGDDAYKFRPQLSVGYRNILNWENTPGLMRFSGGTTGTTFQLDPGVEPEDAIVAGLGLNIDSQFLNLKIGYDAEIGDSSMTHYGSITLRMAFW